ncbi:MAG TPA: ABC transporter permease subunit [Thermoplasmata archaeon]|nr:ABC transporter permease subunit [Thermoplasmata archaeon]
MATPTVSKSILDSDNIRYDASARTRWRLGFDRVIGWLLPLLFVVAIAPILSLVYYISARAIPSLSWQVITSTSPYQTDAMGVPIIGTFELMLLATSIAVLLGLFGGIATAEFLSERTAGWVRMSANLLVGTPSVIVGYFGYFTFVIFFGWSLSLLAGTITLAFFMTPYVFRTADLAFTSVPSHIREAALGSGARPYQYILRVGTPIAFPQILTGIFLAMAIGVGETAPIVLTTAGGKIPPQTLFSPVSWMSSLIWQNFAQAPSTGLPTIAFQAAFLLLVVVVSLNVVVRIISSRYRRRLEGLYA